MAVEQVHIVEVHALKALVEACHEILARAPVAVRAFPHVISRLCGNEQLVAVRSKIVLHELSHGLLCAAVRRAIVVGKVKMGYAVVEGIVCNGSAALVGVYRSKVVPESQAHLWQKHAALAASAVEGLRIVIAGGRGCVYSLCAHVFGVFKSLFVSKRCYKVSAFRFNLQIF